MNIQLFSDQFLKSVWHNDFENYKADRDEAVRSMIVAWSNRDKQKEASAAAALLGSFFVDLWGYRFSGHNREDASDSTYSLYPEYPIARAGQTGGTGSADVAMSWWGLESGADIPQVVGEFKDVRSGLDVQQNRKGNSRSPVKQAADYLREARAGMWGNEPVQPTWALVTDMHEFRLYHFRTIPHAYQRFVISPNVNDRSVALIDDTEEAAFQRFLFVRLFSEDQLIARHGNSPLESLLERQGTQERELENTFYREYRAYREELYKAIQAANPDLGITPGRMVRITQRILDRLIFLLYAEDIGERLGVPANFLRDLLGERAGQRFFSADGGDVWETLKTLFRVLDEGGTIGGMEFFRFNGGLFRKDDQLNSLAIPNRVFCVASQGASSEAQVQHPNTLLYFSAAYNFGFSPDQSGQSLSLYALGRIFEQSITELEILEAQADGRQSLNLLTKRKRDGVYYTPEWVTSFIVDNTVGTRLDAHRAKYGYAVPPVFSGDEIRAHSETKRKTHSSKTIDDYLVFLDQHEVFLQSLTVVDPACGSGAFLIQVFDRLYQEHKWIDAERARVTVQAPLATTEHYTRSILANNIYGVDINPESVEITKLALWLHTVRPNTPLSDLDKNIRCGNSLVAHDFYYDPGAQNAEERTNFQHEFSEFDEITRERINAFDWDAEFQEITARGGFDCVVGNPPYVKLQHFRRVEAPMAEYLVDARRIDGTPLYESTQTGNFDMYLPFIERAVGLLNTDGKLGFIAPSLWLKNEYGEGLRRAVLRGRRLDRWVDFGSFQVFQEATTYTSLQFYNGSPVDTVRVFRAYDGDISTLKWGETSFPVPYEPLPVKGDPAYLLRETERSIMNKMDESGPRLDDPRWTSQIMQGLVTSMDNVYHLERVDAGFYERVLKGGDRERVEIEDEIMHPLVSGPDTKRYIEPRPDTYLLFPYTVDSYGGHLMTTDKLIRDYPKAWAHLREHEAKLRGRESGKMDHEKWYGYVYPKNLDKQEDAKLLVPRLSTRLAIVHDSSGKYYLDNVDVNGITAIDTETGWYLTGILNSTSANFYWRTISKPFRGEYFAANKQFIAPIPIPEADSKTRQRIAEEAQTAQIQYTERTDLERRIAKDLSSRHVEVARRPTSWIAGNADADSFYETLNRSLGIPGELRAELLDGELQVKRGDAIILDEVFLQDGDDGPFILAQWREKVRSLTLKKREDGRKLVNELKGLYTTRSTGLRDRVVRNDHRVRELIIETEETERKIEDLVAEAYGLGETERRFLLGSTR